MTTGTKDTNEREMLVGYSETQMHPDFHGEHLKVDAVESFEVLTTPEQAKAEVITMVNEFVATTPDLVDSAVAAVVGQPPKPEDVPLVAAVAKAVKLEEALIDIHRQAEDAGNQAVIDIDALSHSDAMRHLESQYVQAGNLAEKAVIEDRMARIDAKHGFTVSAEQFTSKPAVAPESSYVRMKNLEAKLKSGILLPEDRKAIEEELNRLDTDKAPEAPAATESSPEAVPVPIRAKPEKAPDPRETLVQVAHEEVARLRVSLANMGKAEIESGHAADVEQQYLKAIDAYGKAKYQLDKDALRRTFDVRAELAREKFKNPKMDEKTGKLDLRFYEPRYETLLNQVDLLKKTEEALLKNADTNPEDLERVRAELAAANIKIDNELRLDAQKDYILKERQAFLDSKSIIVESGKSKTRKRLERLWNAYQKQPRWSKVAISTGISAVIGASTGVGIVGWAAAKVAGTAGGMAGGRIGGWLGDLAGNRLGKKARAEAAVATASQNAAIRSEDLGMAFKSSLDSYEAQAKADRIRQRARIAGTILGAGLAGWGGSQLAHGMTHHELPEGAKPHPVPPESAKVEITPATETTTTAGTENVKVHSETIPLGSRGAIGAFDELQKKLRLDYPDQSAWDKLPFQVREILTMDPHKQAIMHGMYDPSSASESMVVMKGDTLTLTEDGRLVFTNAEGSQDLTHGVAAHGKMFDYETTFKRPGIDSQDIPVETKGANADSRLMAQEQRLDTRYRMSETASEQATARMNAGIRSAAIEDATLTTDQMNANADNVFTANVGGSPQTYSMGDTTVKFLVDSDGRATGIESFTIGPAQDTDVSRYLGDGWKDQVQRSGRLFGPSISKQTRVIEEAMKNIDSVRAMADRFPTGSPERAVLVNQGNAFLGELIRKYTWNQGLFAKAIAEINR